MRLALPIYNPVRECSSCPNRDERTVSAYIVSFQLARQLLQRYPGTWKLDQNKLSLLLDGAAAPLEFGLVDGNLHYGSVVTQVVSRYSPSQGINVLANEICRDFVLPEATQATRPDGLFSLFVKLVEIFHARCGLQVSEETTSNGEPAFVVRLCDEGRIGWVSRDGVAKNRFGEEVTLAAWSGLRLEKAATYLFGFNRFCRHYQSPLAAQAAGAQQ